MSDKGVGLLSRVMLRFCVVGCLAVLFQSAATARVLLEMSEVKLLQEQGEVILVDSRSATAFQAMHIAGAVSIPSNETYRQSGRSDLVASTRDMRRLLTQAGVSEHSRLVVYGDNNYLEISRLFWVLEMFGLRNVSIMNDSFKHWRKQGYGTQTGQQAVTESDFSPSLDEDKLATMLMVYLAIKDDGEMIVDARSALEYEGDESQTGIYGHIPSAINIPWHQNLTADFTQFRPVEELAALYQRVAVKIRYTVYCNKGLESAVNYVALRELGMSVRAYDGSWYEWGLRSSLPRGMGNE
ncbi:MAG: rhodanese-like domain-containing protein [Cycloclasticus sp.]